MKANNTLALITALGMAAASSALAQSATGDAAPPPKNATSATPTRPCWGRPGPQLRHQALLDRYDTNKDGKLETSELAAIGKAVEEGTFRPMMVRGGRRGMGYGPGPRGFAWGRGAGMGPGRHGPGPRAGMGYGPGPRGPRALGGPGYGPRHQQMLEKYDVNHDGTFDDSERAAMRKDAAAGRFQRPGFGPGPRRFGPPPAGNAPDLPPAGTPAPDDQSPQDQE